MQIIAYDLSLTATGYDTGHGPGVLHTAARGVERLRWYRTEIHHHIDELHPDLIVIEDYAYSRAAAHSHETGELGGVIRLAIYDRGIPLVAVVPSALKKWLTGKGNAGKDDMVAVAARLGCSANNNNAVDAWSLRQMALYAYSLAEVPITQYRDEAVSKVVWPVVAGVAA